MIFGTCTSLGKATAILQCIMCAKNDKEQVEDG